MILSISQEHIFYNDKPPERHNHRPYFLCRGPDVPKLDDRVVEIGPLEEYESWVNWNTKIPVRKVYLQHPKYTPEISHLYYRNGYENYENAVPYLQRVISDFCADGYWPLNTNNEEVLLKCLIYDFEILDGYIKCCGIGQFNIIIKSSIDLANEKFEIYFKILDEEPKVWQLIANARSEELNNILIPLVNLMKESHILIGQNILSYDNQELYKRLSEYKNIKLIRDFISTYYYVHQSFYRGKVSLSHEIYPISFDTLLSSKFLYKDFPDGSYGLKTLAPLLDVDVTTFKTRDKSFDKRILERDFQGFGNWSNDNPLCLQYNKDDIYETFGIFLKMYKEILTYMLITGMPFQEIVSGSNTKIADYMTLIRAHNKKVCPPVLEPIKVCKGLMSHFNGKLLTKKEIFDFFRDHDCDSNCFTQSDKNKLVDVENSLEVYKNKLYRCVRYGSEMPEYVEYYPLLLDYISVGGMVYKPKYVIEPLHNVYKADVSAQYPSITKAKKISCDTVRLAKKGEKPDGWCWFRYIGHKDILNIFEYREAENVDKLDEYPKQYFIGYKHNGGEGIITKALSGIMEITTKYKKIPEWQDVYQRTLKPLRNSLTHGILLSLEATSMQYNIAGTAIPTFGQTISNVMVQECVNNGWMLLAVDTDGAEFIKIKDDAKDFKTIIRGVEDYWFKELNYPISFDIELHEHKLYLAHKNYITIHNNKVKLTGATLHATDKPRIAQNIMKKLMLEILPISNTREEFLNNLRDRTSKIVENEFKNIKISDLVMVSSIKPSNEYINGNYKLRVESIQKLLNINITFPTKIEFLVCKQPLPDLPVNRTSSEPISYMWPKDYVEKNNLEIDYNWYKNMIYNYIDTCFDIKKSSSKYPIKGLDSMPDSGQTPVLTTRKRVLQSKLF